MHAMIVEAPGGPEAPVPVRLPIPVPQRGQVRIKVAFVGMNLMDALLRRERRDWMPVTYPFVPGTEHSGIVDAVGEGVDATLVGRRVLSRLSFGGYAEYSIAQASGLIELAFGTSLKLGAANRGCTATAWYALHADARVQTGDTVLVHSAACAVGAMALQIARDAGARDLLADLTAPHSIICARTGASRRAMTGRWRVPVTESVPLTEVASLHARLEARKLMGRAVIEVGGEGIA
ncbi:MAG: zinc-binding alcohol dehydrogenase family protein [Proteobacteria bacterium]|nr:zinc-binding alcohol dehydrogenase family protein [Pseudomonadota bacterium]